MDDGRLWLPGLGLEKASAEHLRVPSCKSASGTRLKRVKPFSSDGQCLSDD